MTHYIHYRGRTATLCAAWQDMKGRVICRGQQKNRNILLETANGRVVVPGRNVRRIETCKYG